MMDHLSLCQLRTDTAVIRFPQRKLQPNGLLEFPYARVNSEIGRSKSLYGLGYDLETFKKPAVVGENQEVCAMIPIMALYHIFLNVPATPDDDADIKILKEKKYPSEIFEGTNCVQQMLLHMKANLHEARERMLKIRHRYEKCRLNEEDERRFWATERCEKCNVKFDTAHRRRRDHSHLTNRR